MTCNNFCFTPDAKQLSWINGSLLGDAFLTKPSFDKKRNKYYGHSAFVKHQCVAHLEYLQGHMDFVPDFSFLKGPYINKAAGKEYERYTFRVATCPFFSSLREKWYPKGDKLVPKDLVFDPITLTYLYCDDGSNVDRCVRIATYGFQRVDVDYLSHILYRDMNIKSHVDKCGVLRILAASYADFIGIVSPYIPWKCFAHKIVFRESKVRRYTAQEKEIVLKMWEAGCKSQREIARRTKIPRTTVSGMLRCMLDPNFSLNNTSGCKYVNWDKTRGKWKVQVEKKGVRFIKRYDSKEEAIEVAKEFIKS